MGKTVQCFANDDLTDSEIEGINTLYYHVYSVASTPKKKINRNKGLKGQKWFKGSPRRSQNRLRASKQLLKHTPPETSPQPVPLPPQVVEIEVDGKLERFGVFDILPCIEKVQSLFSFFLLQME